MRGKLESIDRKELGFTRGKRLLSLAR